MPQSPKQPNGERVTPRQAEVLDALKDGPRSVVDLMVKFGVKQNTIRSYLHTLREMGRVRAAGGEGIDSKYALTERLDIHP